MSWYRIENREKYGVNELQFFVNSEKNVKMVIDVNWKWAVFTVNLENEPVSPVDSVEIYEHFEEVHLDGMESGTEEFSFIDMKTDERLNIELFDELIEEYHNEGVNALYDNGFDEELDPEIHFIGGFNVEEAENPYEF